MPHPTTAKLMKPSPLIAAQAARYLAKTKYCIRGASLRVKKFTLKGCYAFDEDDGPTESPRIVSCPETEPKVAHVSKRIGGDKSGDMGGHYSAGLISDLKEMKHAGSSESENMDGVSNDRDEAAGLEVMSASEDSDYTSVEPNDGDKTATKPASSSGSTGTCAVSSEGNDWSESMVVVIEEKYVELSTSHDTGVFYSDGGNVAQVTEKCACSTSSDDMGVFTSEGKDGSDSTCVAMIQVEEEKVACSSGREMSSEGHY
ncbi:hypothetical protein K470DRAFT_270168 [Piedraia hortae CBS 480.64]|uniref:Uncharacterized protein n=1 Tax=Piedraia hortae CBS 480.64 TaxID=1314780 RepID=A0A6A7C148_9PEZI|nr:hypothetical protein K470DRAFT_270168 [Piedraia hortae CBS 480.64]